MIKIKKDKFRKCYEIIQDGVPVFSCPVNQFVELANAVVKYVVGKDYIISSPDRQAKAKGYGKYHYFKGFLLAGWHDLKKKFKKEKYYAG
jgi:hypothetical protein